MWSFADFFTLMPFHTNGSLCSKSIDQKIDSQWIWGNFNFRNPNSRTTKLQELNQSNDPHKKLLRFTQCGQRPSLAHMCY